MHRSGVLGLTAAIVLLACHVTDSVAGTDVKFMTYNVRAPGWNADRRVQVVATIDDQAPDVLGLQEASSFGPGGDLLADLSDDYDPRLTGTADPIYLRRDSGFVIVGEGTVPLPACPGLGGSFNLNWVRVETPDGVRITYYNSHFCVSSTPGGQGSPEGNQGQAIAAVEFIDGNTEAGELSLMGGDLNASQNSPTILYLTQNQPLVLDDETFFNPIEIADSWALAPLNQGGTRPGTTAGGGTTAIDWILVRPATNVIDAEVIDFEIPPGEEDGFSDHLPVTATLDVSPPSGVGAVPDGDTVHGTVLTADRAPEGRIALAWGRSCATTDIDFHVYEGNIGQYYDHSLLFCTTGGATALDFVPASESSYYLIVPSDGAEEGSYGWAGDGVARPPGLAACTPLAAGASCE